MWYQTRLSNLLGIRYPIIQAPMAGGPTTPELVAAVSNGGGLGSIGAAGLSGEQILSTAAAVRRLTERPFAFNLILPPAYVEDRAQIEQMQRRLQHYYAELGLELPPAPSRYAHPIEEQLEAVIEARVPIFSFTFGLLPDEWMQRMQQAGVLTIGTATTVREALALERSGVAAIVAQGSEAGGHRGTFLGPVEQSLVGTLALVPQVVDHVSLPVIAAGGIMDGRGVLAALALGAAGVQMGTAFLTCDEAGVPLFYKQILLQSTEEHSILTRVFSGKHARGLRNRFIEELEPDTSQVPPYPIQHALTGPLRQAAAQQQRPELVSLWAGQGTRLCRRGPAARLLAEVVGQVEASLRGLADSQDGASGDG